MAEHTHTVEVPIAFYEWRATIEKDVRVHDLTPHEQAALVKALAATRPAPKADSALVEAWRYEKKYPASDGYVDIVSAIDPRTDTHVGGSDIRNIRPLAALSDRDVVLEEAAKVVERRRDQRFEEHGTREPDTNATHYSGSAAETYEALDEEDEEIAQAIRALKGGVDE